MKTKKTGPTKLDRLLAEVEADIKAGRTKPFPRSWTQEPAKRKKAKR